MLLRASLGEEYSFELLATEAQAGSGSSPEVVIESLAIAVRARTAGAAAIERIFRGAEPPIVGRIENDEFLLDLRLIDDPGDLVPALRDN